jgi:hypothetical protein
LNISIVELESIELTTEAESLFTMQCMGVLMRIVPCGDVLSQIKGIVSRDAHIFLLLYQSIDLKFLHTYEKHVRLLLIFVRFNVRIF